MMPTNWSMGHRCLGCYCPMPSPQPSVPVCGVITPGDLTAGSDYQGLPCLLSMLGASTLYRESKSLNVTDSTNKNPVVCSLQLTSLVSDSAPTTLTLRRTI